MALNFPNTPSDGQLFTDTTGQQWVYETATNSWTAMGQQGGGMIYKGGIDITAAPPAGAASGWLYTVTTGGTPNAGFTGLTGNLSTGAQIMFDGASWQRISPDLTFTQAGSGAATRTVESKLRDVVSVLDFIPKSEHSAIQSKTSTYDATAGIQAAINSISTADYQTSGGTIYFPSGTYRITSPLVFPALGEYTIKGDGNSRILKVGTTAATGLGSITTAASLAVNPNVDAVIICLAGTSSYTYSFKAERVTLVRDTKGTNSYVMFAPCMATSTFDSCAFSGPAVNGFFSTDLWNSTFHRCTFSDCDYGFIVDPLQDSYAGTSLTLNSCYAENNTNGYKLVNVLYSTLISCGCDYTAAGGYAYSFEGTATKSPSVSLLECATEHTAGRHVYVNKGDINFNACLFSEGDGLVSLPSTYGNGFELQNAYVTMSACVHYPKNASDATINSVSSVLTLDKYRVCGGAYGSSSLNIALDANSRINRLDIPSATTNRFTASGNIYHEDPYVNKVIFKNPANYTESASIFPYTNFGNAPANPTSYPIGTLAIDVEYGKMWIRRNDGKWYLFTAA